MPQPFKITAETEGLDKLINQLDPNRFVAQALREIALLPLFAIQESIMMARSTVPIKTGLLQSLIQLIEWNETNLEAVGGTLGSGYAVFVEFGTVKMAERPFWRPAVWEAFYRMLDEIHKIMERHFK